MNENHPNQLQNKEKEQGENDGNNNKIEESNRQSISVALPVRRVKQGKIGKDSIIVLDEFDNTISYDPMLDTSKMLCGCSKKEKKTVNLFELLEIRQGYRTDNWHRAVRMKRFQETAPVSFDKNKALDWVEELRLLLNNKENGRGKKEENLNENNFNENWWLLKNFKNADLDKNGKIGFNELWKLLKRLNLQLSELYVKALFK
uniref:EF-hand domain-containing protein n=1 Tax=Meloidogyne floridensis TaxID=298350 RepID=A0A915NQV1_9BILA